MLPRRLPVRLVLDELQPVVGEREEMNVVPSFGKRVTIEAERLLRARRIDRERGKRIGQLIAGNSALELEGADVVLVESLSQLLQYGILRIRRHAFDHQLLASDTKRQGVALAGEEQSEPIRDSVYRDTE